MNLALAQLLKGDLNMARQRWNQFEPCKCGAPSYLKAVIAARLVDKDGVSTFFARLSVTTVSGKLCTDWTLNFQVLY
jgi:hypothetical protein